jgi:hypothetical protein
MESAACTGFAQLPFYKGVRNRTPGVRFCPGFDLDLLDLGIVGL